MRKRAAAGQGGSGRHKRAAAGEASPLPPELVPAAPKTNTRSNPAEYGGCKAHVIFGKYWVALYQPQLPQGAAVTAQAMEQLTSSQTWSDRASRSKNTPVLLCHQLCIRSHPGARKGELAGTDTIANVGLVTTATRRCRRRQAADLPPAKRLATCEYQPGHGRAATGVAR